MIQKFSFQSNVNLNNSSDLQCPYRSNNLSFNLNTIDEQCLYYHIIVLLDEFDKNHSENNANLNLAYPLTKELICKNPTNFYYQCIFICIAQYLGLYLAALDEFKKMDVKNIQLDSVLYLISENAADLGHFDHALDAFQRAFVLYYSNRKEVSEILAIAFKQGAYLKVIDFYAFQWSIENSLQWLMIEGEALAIEPLVSVQNPQDISNFYTLNETYSEKIILTPQEISQLVDNRDYNLIEFEPGKRYSWVNKLFTRKTIPVAHLYALIQLLCKRLHERDFDGLQRAFEQFDSLLAKIPKDNSSYYLFYYIRNLILHLSSSEKVTPLEDILDSLKIEIESFDLNCTFEKRIHLTHLVICFCYSCICFALLKDGIKESNCDLSVKKLTILGNQSRSIGKIFMQKIQELPIFSSFEKFGYSDKAVLFYDGEELSKLLSNCNKEYEREISRLKSSFSALIRQKLVLVSKLI